MAGFISDESKDIITGVQVAALASRIGYRLVRAGTWLQLNCPNCGSPKCFIGNRKGFFICYGGGGCGAQGFVLDFYVWHQFRKPFEKKEHFYKSVHAIAEIMGIEIKYQDGSTHQIDPNIQPFDPAEFPPLEEVEPESTEVCDRTYRRFLSLCPIYQDHVDEWRSKRQYTDSQIRAFNLRSVPRTPSEAKKIIDTLLHEGYVLERVPGFTKVLKAGTDPDIEANWFWAFVTPRFAKYFLPVRDDTGFIPRLRIATSDPEKKYVWFSSAPLITENYARRGGAPSGAPINVTVPEKIMLHWEPGMEITDIYFFDMVVVTEGEHKSNISTNILQKPIIGIPGVGNYKDVLPTVQKWGVKKVAIAYDMDSFLATDKQSGKNEKVFQKLKQFAKELLENTGIEIVLWVWNNADGKGLDDLLLSRKTPIEINLRSGLQTPVKIA